MNQERLVYLYKQYLSNQCTHEEINQLLQYFDQADEASLSDLIQAALNQADNTAPACDEEKARLSKILEGVHKAIAKTGEEKYTIRRRIIIRYSVAATIALLIGSVIFWRFFQNTTPAKPEQPRQVATTLPDKIVPGHSGAVLQLANGKTIVLDSAQNGTLVFQNNVQVVKENGQIKYLGDAGKVEYNTISTDRGREWQIVLPDGTKVWLNAATTMKFPTSFDQLASREIELNGEAYFEVADNKAKPFIVHTAKQNIKDLGTRFNVSSYADDPFTKTTLLQGVVEINEKKILKPGEQAVTTGEDELKVTTALSADDAISWKNGYFSFSDDTIYDIMRKLARWYNVEVVYDSKVSNESMEGSMSRFGDVSKVLDIIQKAGPFQFTITQRAIHVNATIN